jgi:transcription initiation factor IIF auxiliary subunit
MRKKKITGRYSVDENGNVYSGEIMLNPPTYSTGYKVVKLFKNGKYKRVSVHRLVAKAFIKNPHNKEFVNHINGIKDDNRVENLEWVTSHENHIHAAKIGLKAKGESHGVSKLKNDDIIGIRQMLSDKVPQRKIASIFNVSQAAIKDINRGNTWRSIQ